jgi:hypothetical protein
MEWNSTHRTEIIAALKRDVDSRLRLYQLAEEEIHNEEAVDAAEECLRPWRAGRGVCARNGGRNRVGCARAGIGVAS